MKPQTIALSAAVASVAASVVSTMCPSGVDCQALPDSRVRRGYLGAGGVVLALGAAAAALDGTWFPLVSGALVVVVLCGAHDYVQRTGE